MFDKRFNCQNILNTNKENSSGNCYWCKESKGLESCKNCDNYFCKFCIKKTEVDETDVFVCFICGCLEATKIVSQPNSYLDDRELMHMLRRYESLCNDRKMSCSVNEVLADIAAMDVEHLPQLIEVVRGNIYSMLSDIEKLSTLVSASVEENGLKVAQYTLLPLLKVVTKHHLFNRLGRPSHCLTYQNTCQETVSPARAHMIHSDPHTDSSRPEISPSLVDDDERITPGFLLDEEDEPISVNDGVTAVLCASMNVVANNSPALIENDSVKENIKCVPTETSTKGNMIRQSLKRAAKEANRSMRTIGDESRSLVVATSSKRKIYDASNDSPIGTRTRGAKNTVTDCEPNKSLVEVPTKYSVEGTRKSLTDDEFVINVTNNSLTTVGTKDLVEERIVEGANNSETRALTPDFCAVNNSPTETRPTMMVGHSQRSTWSQLLTETNISQSEANNSLSKKRAMESPRCSKDMLNKRAKVDQEALSGPSLLFSDIKTEKRVCSLVMAKPNPHLVAPVLAVQERSFVFKETATAGDIIPHVEKTWSWSTAVGNKTFNKNKITIPFKNRLSETALKQVVSARTSLSVEPLRKEKSFSTETLSVEPLRKRGRPRKYFSTYNIDLSQNSQDEQ